MLEIALHAQTLTREELLSITNPLGLNSLLSALVFKSGPIEEPCTVSRPVSNSALNVSTSEITSLPASTVQSVDGQTLEPLHDTSDVPMLLCPIQYRCSISSEDLGRTRKGNSVISGVSRIRWWSIRRVIHPRPRSITSVSSGNCGYLPYSFTEVFPSARPI